MGGEAARPDGAALRLRLKKRADFVAAAKGKRVFMRAFSLQGKAKDQDPSIRFGFTVTKKTGRAVVRNRIRRRLKEAVRLAPGLAAMPGHDYVLVARAEALRAGFADLQRELHQALERIHGGKSASGAGRRQGSSGPEP